MKKMKRIFKACFAFLLVSYITLLNLSIIASAEEGEFADMTFRTMVEVESYSIEEGHIEAGKEAHITLTLRNASSSFSADSLIVDISSNSKMLYPSYGNDNQFLVGSLTPNSTAIVTIPIIISSSFNGEYIDLIANLEYEIGNSKISNTSTMLLPAQSTNSIIVNSLDVSAHATVNGKSLLSIGYYNRSSENITDAVIIVDGNVSDVTKEISLDAIVAGKAYTKDCNIIFDESGEQSITITLRYTDINGEQVNDNLGTYKVSVGVASDTSAVSNNSNRTLVFVGRIIASVAAIGVLIIVYVYFKKK